MRVTKTTVTRAEYAARVGENVNKTRDMDIRGRIIVKWKAPRLTFLFNKNWRITATRQASATESITPVFLNRRAAVRYRALASIIPGREKPQKTTIRYKISLAQLITNLNVILYLSTCHTVYISVLTLLLFMIMP